MTVIAWDGKKMSADKLGWGAPMGVVTKIHFVNGEVVGIAGKSSQIADVLEWVKNGFSKETMPEHQKDPEKFSSIIVVDKDGRLRVYESGPNPWYNERSLHAVGSGCDVAMGAMMHGATSAEAVTICIKYGGGCGIGYDEITPITGEKRTVIFP